MKGLQIYDYEKVRSEYQYSLEVITPPNNDGSRPRYAFPIKYQVLRCGKWIPTEEMYYNALYLYYYLHQEEVFKSYMKGYKECLAFIEAQRDDVKFAVHTSQVGKPLILSKKQFGDWVLGDTYGYLRVYPYLSLDDVRKNLQLPIATDDDGNEVILPYLIIPKTE